jgi:hypothetical protein
MHGSAAGQVKRKAAERVARQRAGAHLAAAGIELQQTDPLLELGKQLSLSAVTAERVRELVAELSTIHSDAFPNELHVLVKLWNEERDRTARMAKLSVDLGVPGAAVQLAHDQGALMAEITERTFADPLLDLTEAQKKAGRKVIAAHLRESEPTPHRMENEWHANGTPPESLTHIAPPSASPRHP